MNLQGGELAMKIAVCEDVREEADWLCKVIEKWSSEKEIHADVISFSDAASFLFTTEDTVWDILFLDIKMPGEDGIALAKRLRAKKDDIPIVFVTGEKEYVMEGYEVEAAHYLLKPVSEQKVFICLDRIYGKMGKQGPVMILQAEGVVVKLLQKEIYKIEVFSHKLVYTTKKGTYEVSSSMKEVKKALQEDCFVSCHRGMLVNLRYVETIYKNYLVLSDREMDFYVEVPVSRRLYNQINEAFIAYYGGKMDIRK